MIKKIILWTLVAGFSGALIFGAINRTNIKLDNEDHERVLNSKNENGNPSSQGGQYVNEGNRSGTEGRGQGGRNISLDSSGAYLSADNWNDYQDRDYQDSDYQNSDYQGRGYQDRSYQDSVYQDRYLESECDEDHKEDHIFTTLSGEGRAWRFVQEQSLNLSVGDQITLNGFFEDGEYKVAVLKNVSNGQIVNVRDVDGHPLWFGNG